MNSEPYDLPLAIGYGIFIGIWVLFIFAVGCYVGRAGSSEREKKHKG